MSASEAPGGLAGTVIRGIGFAGGGFVITRLLTLVTYIVLARLITPEELGEFAAGSILVGVGVLLSGSGMAAALIHRDDRIEDAAATAVVATALAGALIGLLSVALAPLLGVLFDSDTVAAVTVALAGVLFLNSALVVPDALLQRRFSFVRRLVIEPAAAIAFGIAAIVTTSNGLGVWGLVIGLYSSAVTHFVLSWVLAQWRPRLGLASIAMWKELIAYGRHVLAGSAVRRLGDRIPILAAGAFVSTAALGQYQYANRIAATAFALLVSGVSYVVFPAFARISRDARRFEAAFLRALRWVVLLAMPIGMLLLALGEPLAVLVFGERWREAGEATRALAAFVPAMMVAQMIGEGFKATGRPAERTKTNLVGVGAGVVAMAVLIPPFGLLGVALGVSIDAIAAAGVAMRRARRSIGVRLRPMLEAIALPLGAALPALAVVLPLDQLLVDAGSRGTAIGLLMLAAEGLLAVAIYAGGLRLLVPDLLDELRGIIQSGRRGTERPPPSAEEEEEADLVDAQTDLA